jgi:hypothetical protein
MGDAVEPRRIIEDNALDVRNLDAEISDLRNRCTRSESRTNALGYAAAVPQLQLVSGCRIDFQIEAINPHHPRRPGNHAIVCWIKLGESSRFRADSTSTE